MLDEVAGKWTSYSDVSQRAIAKAMAGKQRLVPEHTVTYERRFQKYIVKNDAISEESWGQRIPRKD